MEAPTFTTIERNQQAAMLALDWDHQVVNWDHLTVMPALDWDHQVVNWDQLKVILEYTSLCVYYAM